MNLKFIKVINIKVDIITEYSIILWLFNILTSLVNIFLVLN